MSTDSPDHATCSKALEQALASSEKARFLLDKIMALGCTPPAGFLACRPCEGMMTGGFSVKMMEDGSVLPQVVLCENSKNIRPEEFRSTLVHELVHAYDTCRAKIDMNKCTQHACTEIRAASISGECNFAAELLRGNVKAAGGHQACTKRRAAESVSHNPACRGALAKEAVEQAFDKCYKDTEPFRSMEQWR